MRIHRFSFRMSAVSCAAALALSLFVFSPAHAQYGARALVNPGEPVPAKLLEQRGGVAGQALAKIVGKRPVLVMYWRPGDPMSERALVNTAAALKQRADGVAFQPIAVLAAGQPEADVQIRLQDLKMGNYSSPVDVGTQLARVLGVNRVPYFALFDAGTTLRAVGASSVMQPSAQGPSILDAATKAASAQPVPTLGVLPAQSVHRMLGRKFPAFSLTEKDGRTYRKVSEYLKPDKKLLIFYWAPNCSHCKEALPKLKQWYDLYKPAHIDVISISRGDAPHLRKLGDEIAAQYPWLNLVDPEYGAGPKLYLTQTPTTFLLSDDGEIESIQVGGEVDWAGWLGKKSVKN